MCVFFALFLINLFPPSLNSEYLHSVSYEMGTPVKNTSLHFPSEFEKIVQIVTYKRLMLAVPPLSIL